VVQPRRRPCFTAKSFQRPGITGRVTGQDLERDAAAERHLLGLVNDAHAAPANFAQQAKVADLLRRRRHPVHRFAAVLLRLLNVGQSGEYLTDVVGQVRMTVDVLLQRRPLAAPVALDELLGEVVEQLNVPGGGVAR
jgi:hypothetical protein